MSSKVDVEDRVVREILKAFEPYWYHAGQWHDTHCDFVERVKQRKPNYE